MVFILWRIEMIKIFKLFFKSAIFGFGFLTTLLAYGDCPTLDLPIKYYKCPPNDYNKYWESDHFNTCEPAYEKNYKIESSKRWYGACYTNVFLGWFEGKNYPIWSVVSNFANTNNYNVVVIPKEFDPLNPVNQVKSRGFFYKIPANSDWQFGQIE